MIPYAIMCGKVYSEDGVSTEIRVLELSADGFTFRLPVDYEQVHGRLSRIEMSFYGWDEKSYSGVSIELTDDNTSVESGTEYYTVYAVKSNDSEYRRQASSLTKEYMKYIDCKLNLSDAEMSAQMAGYPCEQEEIYAEDYEAQLECFATAIMSERASVKHCARMVAEEACEIAYSLETIELVDMYLRMHTDEFVMSVFEKNHLEKHPFAHAKIDRLHIGNEYCYNLIPDADTVMRVAEKSLSEGLEITIVLPPIPESKYEEVCEYIDKCVSRFPQAEICVNDIGMRKYAEDKYSSSTVVNGILLDKYRRDPRMKYAEDMKGDMGSKASAVYFPYYQTNTGTFCPLYAAVNNGGRGNQERVNACSHECERKVFAYPAHLNMIGRYNSLFGVGYAAIESVSDAYTAPRRVVLNL